ncbi:MAG: LPXTG cell wall anchor domain-containing protein [Lachnospiraceae bacterium]|nr:LPXTG cell wall anchor domain-containing protein [Lachnospiraceae bacterium]
MNKLIKGAIVALSAAMVFGIASADSVELQWDAENNHYEVTKEACDIINTGSFEIVMSATAGADTDNGWVWIGLYEYDASGAELYHWGTDGYKITEAGDAVIDETFSYWKKTDGAWTTLSTESTLDGKPSWGKIEIGSDVTISKIVVKTKGDDSSDDTTGGTDTSGSSDSSSASGSSDSSSASGSSDSTNTNTAGSGSSTSNTSSTPKTGDSTAVAATALLAVVSLAGLVVLKKKEN